MTISSGRCIAHVSEIQLVIPGSVNWLINNSTEFYELQIHKDSALVSRSHLFSRYVVNPVWPNPFGYRGLLFNPVNQPFSSVVSSGYECWACNANKRGVGCFSVPLYSSNFELLVVVCNGSQEVKVEKVCVDLKRMKRVDTSSKSEDEKQSREKLQAVTRTEPASTKQATQNIQNSTSASPSTASYTSIVITMKDGSTLVGTDVSDTDHMGEDAGGRGESREVYKPPNGQRGSPNLPSSHPLQRCPTEKTDPCDIVESDATKHSDLSAASEHIFGSPEYTSELVNFRLRLAELGDLMECNQRAICHSKEILNSYRSRRYGLSVAPHALAPTATSKDTFHPFVTAPTHSTTHCQPHPTPSAHSSLAALRRSAHSSLDSHSALRRSARSVYRSRSLPPLSPVRRRSSSQNLEWQRNRTENVRQKLSIEMAKNSFLEEDYKIRYERYKEIKDLCEQIEARHKESSSLEAERGMKREVEWRNIRHAIQTRRGKMVHDLFRIFPIESIRGECRSIRGLPLPAVSALLASEYREEESISTGIGFAVHLLVMLAKYLDIPLRFELRCASSSSTVTDSLINAHVDDVDQGGGVFPLSYRTKGPERPKYNTGILLLAANVEQFAAARGMKGFSSGKLQRSAAATQSLSIRSAQPAHYFTDQNQQPPIGNEMWNQNMSGVVGLGDTNFVCDEGFCLVMGDDQDTTLSTACNADGSAAPFGDLDILEVLERVMHREISLTERSVRRL